MWQGVTNATALYVWGFDTSSKVQHPPRRGALRHFGHCFSLPCVWANSEVRWHCLNSWESCFCKTDHVTVLTLHPQVYNYQPDQRSRPHSYHITGSNAGQKYEPSSRLNVGEVYKINIKTRWRCSVRIFHTNLCGNRVYSKPKREMYITYLKSRAAPTLQMQNSHFIVSQRTVCDRQGSCNRQKFSTLPGSSIKNGLQILGVFKFPYDTAPCSVAG
jgi:hypothetical protein